MKLTAEIPQVLAAKGTVPIDLQPVLQTLFVVRVLATPGSHDRNRVVEVLPTDATGGIIFEGFCNNWHGVFLQCTLWCSSGASKNSCTHHHTKQVRQTNHVHPHDDRHRHLERGVHKGGIAQTRCLFTARSLFIEGTRSDCHHQSHTIPHEAEEHDHMLEHTDAHGPPPWKIRVGRPAAEPLRDTPSDKHVEHDRTTNDERPSLQGNVAVVSKVHHEFGEHPKEDAEPSRCQKTECATEAQIPTAEAIPEDILSMLLHYQRISVGARRSLLQIGRADQDILRSGGS